MKALILVDIQNDFLPGGNLPVPHGNEIIGVANQVQQKFDFVVATKDWHPGNHKSFASQHPGKKPGDIIRLNGIEQILWPDHCVQDSSGALFPEGLDTDYIRKVIYKGTDENIDSYSGFLDNDRKKETGLEKLLNQSGIRDIYVMGLATDYCVKFTALDGINMGFNVMLLKDGCRGVGLHEGDIEKAIQEMKNKGVRILTSSEL